ncbi:MAG: GAF domain-containing protein [Anaerolineae bacterium]|nr:GAF domain-containing protein [Anaerolineae bacterium]
MKRWIDRIFPLDLYTQPFDHARARLIYWLAGMIILTGVLARVLVREPDGRSYIQTMGENLPAALAFLSMMVAQIISILLVRNGRLRLASLTLIFFGTLGIGTLLIPSGLYGPSLVLLLPLLIFVGSMLLDITGLVLGTLLSIGIMALALAYRGVMSEPIAYSSSTVFVVGGFMLLLTAGAAALSLRFLRLSRVEALTTERHDRLSLAQITSQVAQRIARRASLQEVLDNTVEEVIHSYPLIYHAQVFLIDEDTRQANLVASTGEVGRLMLERKHQLGVGTKSVIGQVTARDAALIARVGLDDSSIHRRNEFLPETAAEAAFPLRLADRVIGALDLQSKQRDAFEQEDIPIFQSLADHIAIAIDNARLYEETRRQIEENQRLAQRAQQTAEEVERLNRRLTGQAWNEYLSQQPEAPALTVNFNEGVPVPESPWTATLQQAVRQNQTVQGQAADRRVVAVPLRVRGQVIGAMEFELDEQNPLLPEDLSLLEEVSEQFGLAAETNRLFESSQRIAQREALVNEIATRLQTTSSVEMTLTTAARSLKEVLKAERVAIRLGKPTRQAEPTSNGGKAE